MSAKVLQMDSSFTGSLCRDLRVGARVTKRAKQFWILWSLVIYLDDKVQKKKKENYNHPDSY